MASDQGREDKGRAPSTSFQAMDKNAEVEVGCCSAGLVWGRVWLNQEQEKIEKNHATAMHVQTPTGTRVA